MSDYIDLHSHTLYGVDDGASDFEESRAMLRAAHEAGFSTVACTPHRLEGGYDVDDRVSNQGVEKLQGALLGDPPVKLIAGGEFYLDDHFWGYLDRNEVFPIGDSSCLLVELPMMHLPPFFGEYAFRIRLKGYVPLLAHPERYNYIQDRPKRALELLDKGFLLQINLGSLAGQYGRWAYKTAKYLVKKGMATVAASDLHKADQAETIYGKGIVELKKIAGEKGVNRLLRDAPQMLLNSDYHE